jgi:hypothetical protein
MYIFEGGCSWYIFILLLYMINILLIFIKLRLYRASDFKSKKLLIKKISGQD